MGVAQLVALAHTSAGGASMAFHAVYRNWWKLIRLRQAYGTHEVIQGYNPQKNMHVHNICVLITNNYIRIASWKLEPKTATSKGLVKTTNYRGNWESCKSR